MKIVYQHENQNPDSRYKLTLRLSAIVVKEAKQRNFNISKMVEEMLIDAINEHDEQERVKQIATDRAVVAAAIQDDYRYPEREIVEEQIITPPDDYHEEIEEINPHEFEIDENYDLAQDAAHEAEAAAEAEAEREALSGAEE